MVELINMQDTSLIWEEPNEFKYQGELHRTDAKVFPFPEDVDPALLTLVCACMITNPYKCPNLATVLRSVQRGCRKRAADYGTDPMERDEAISSLWKELVYNAPTSEEDPGVVSDDEPDDEPDDESDDDI